MKIQLKEVKLKLMCFYTISIIFCYLKVIIRYIFIKY